MMKKFTYALFAFTLLFASCNNGEETPYTPPVGGPYSRGIIFYGTTWEDLAFFDPAKSTFHAGNLFENANGTMVSEGSASGGINDVYIYGGKAYLLTPKTSETGDKLGKARIAVTDAGSFKLEKSIYANGFDMATLGFIYNLMVVDENKFYIGYNPSSNNGGIRVLKVDPEDGTTTFSGDIAGTSGAIGVDGPATFQRMLRQGDWVVAACGSKVQFINTSTDQVDATKTIQISSKRQVADVLKGRDGYIYALVAGKCAKEGYWMWSPPDYESNASIVKINPTDFSVVYQEDLVDANGEQLDIKACLEGNGAVAARTSNEILFTVGAVYGRCQVYAFDFVEKTTRLVASPLGMFGKYMAADPYGNVYVPQIENYSTCNTQVYNIASGERMSDIENLIEPVKGDGGFVSTYIF